MKLVSFLTKNGVSYGSVCVKDDRLVVADFPYWLSGYFPRTINEFLAGESYFFDLYKKYLPFILLQTPLLLSEVTILPVVPNPPKILCVGLNYADHAKECGDAVPDTPVIFCKTHNTLLGHNEAIEVPSCTQKADFEAELVVVIGKQGRNIPESDAMNHVGGYTCGNDVTARDWQFERPGKQWFLGKSFDTFAPVGPWIMTKDEIPQPNQLGIRSILNGKTMQQSNTSNFIFSIEKIISYISQAMTLMPGDLIFTGTPPGIGYGRNPQVFLSSGDTIEIEIDGIGKLTNTVM